MGVGPGVGGSRPGLIGAWNQVRIQIRVCRKERKMGSSLEIRARGVRES